ncbi:MULTISPECIES: ribbon-helix-helix domain-containing protein [unclassified Microcoleus]|jgi:predicted transcriptional regulator|uniref:ribbon-helix-helix domain-containing protein n=2 Tax=unclassified Microcoleus TaxID=2642155 RepID=UPI002FCF920A
MPSRMRVTVTLPEDVHQALSEWAEEEDRTLANLLSHVAAKAVRDRQELKKDKSENDRP